MVQPKSGETCVWAQTSQAQPKYGFGVFQTSSSCTKQCHPIINHSITPKNKCHNRLKGTKCSRYCKTNPLFLIASKVTAHFPFPPTITLAPFTFFYYFSAHFLQLKSVLFSTHFPTIYYFDLVSLFFTVFFQILHTNSLQISLV